MKILISGDTYGKVGRSMLVQYIPIIKKDYAIDFIISNIENIADGKGITASDYQFCHQIGIDVLTSGNHILFRNEGHKLLDDQGNILRPLNFNDHTPGKGTNVYLCKNKRIRVSNVIGRTFMDHYGDPFAALNNVVSHHKDDIHIVDMHAETTSEKIALAWAFDGKITALVGTHTHVQTADERILPKGTAFLTDLGMTGPYNSIIGANPDEVLHRFKTGMLARFKQATGDGQFCAIILDINDQTNKVEKMERIFISPQRPYCKPKSKKPPNECII